MEAKEDSILMTINMALPSHAAILNRLGGGPSPEPKLAAKPPSHPAIVQRFLETSKQLQEKGPASFIKERIAEPLAEYVGRPALRAYSALASSGIVNLPRPIGLNIPPRPTQPLKPTGAFQTSLYGTDKPITLRTVAGEVGVPEQSAFAPAVGAFLGGADLIPGGGKGVRATATGIRNLVKYAKEFSDTTDTAKIIARITKDVPNIAEDTANILSKRLATARNAEEVAVVLSDTATEITTFTRTGGSTAIRERGFVSSAKEVIPDAQKIAGQYIPRSTDALSQAAANLIRDDIKAAQRLALQGTDERAVATASELLKHYARLAETAADPAVRNALFDSAAEIANTTARNLTEQGRTVQAAAILGRLTPEGQVRFAAREIQKWNTANPRQRVPELTGGQALEITDEMKAIQQMPEGEAKAIRFQRLQSRIQDLVPSTWWRKAVAVWKAGLLTGIKTSGLNVLSNVSHAITETAKDIPAAATDALLSLFTGKRTLAFTVRGLPEGVTEGAKKGWTYLKTGYDSRDIAAKLDYRRVNFKHKSVQKYVDTVFRVLGTEDQPFYYGALKRSLYNQAIVQAKNERLHGAEREALIQRLVQNPTDEMTAYALADAETAVFQNRTVLGSVARQVQNIPGAEFVVPFGRTPSAVAMQVINYSPIGAFVEIGKQIARGAFDQRKLSQAVGRTAVGTGVLWVGGQLFNAGLMTLDYPKTERERELWKAEGRKANAVKVGDSWRTVQTLGPAGPVLLIGGHFQRALKETGSQTASMITAAFGTMKSFTEQTFLKGVNDTLAAISDPERNATNVGASFISSFIPTIINDVARSLDEKERRMSDDSFLKTVANRVIGRIPVAREELEPQVTVLGEELQSIGNPLEIMLDPTRPSPDTSTPVAIELRRLTDAGFKVSPTLLGDRNGFNALTPEENTNLWKLAGRILNQKLSALFALEKYQRLSDEEKGDVVEDFVKQAQVNARAATVLEMTAGLSGEALKAELAELKEGGLLTREVFEKYQELR